MPAEEDGTGVADALCQRFGISSGNLDVLSGNSIGKLRSLLEPAHQN